MASDNKPSASLDKALRRATTDAFSDLLEQKVETKPAKRRQGGEEEIAISAVLRVKLTREQVVKLSERAGQAVSAAEKQAMLNPAYNLDMLTLDAEEALSGVLIEWLQVGGVGLGEIVSDPQVIAADVIDTAEHFEGAVGFNEEFLGELYDFEEEDE